MSSADEKEFSPLVPRGDIDSICGMVTGMPFDMARDGERIIGEAAGILIAGGHG